MELTFFCDLLPQKLVRWLNVYFKTIRAIFVKSSVCISLTNSYLDLVVLCFNGLCSTFKRFLHYMVCNNSCQYLGLLIIFRSQHLFSLSILRISICSSQLFLLFLLAFLGSERQFIFFPILSCEFHLSYAVLQSLSVSLVGPLGQQHVGFSRGALSL